MSEAASTPDAGGPAELLRRIERAWLEGRPRDLVPLFHPHVVMALPGFAGRAEGRETLVGGFVDFCENARIVSFDHDEPQIDVIGDTAVATTAFTMVYELESQRYRSTGRDLWVFARQGGEWLAVWRTMLDTTDEPVEG
ncbi:MAG TPA: nuclear transport factor 2 family protein [Longimicrobiaceae bacterium]